MKSLGYVVLFLLGMGLGVFIKMMIPAGGPPAGMMGMGNMPPPAVVAIVTSESPLEIRREYIASVEPVQDVMVKTEVAGYIDEVHFKEGSLVNAGDLLFTIDQEKYRAMVDVRVAEQASAQSNLDLANNYLKRMESAGKGSISLSDLETAQADALRAVALLKQADANVALAKINLAYSEIRSPITGKIGAALMTKGNYVSSGSDTLAHIVQLDPMRVVFSMTDRDFLSLRQKELAGELDELVAGVRLPNNAELALVGQKDFSDNEIDSATGTMAVRYLFDNPNGLLVPGGYVTMMLGLPAPPQGICIPQRALLADKDGAYVLTADEAGTIGVARIQVGKTIGSTIVVESGLEVGATVVVDGLQKVQPGAVAQVMIEGAE